MWIFIGSILFTISWTYTGGGYLCSIPLSILISMYVTLNTKWKGLDFVTMRSVLKSNISSIILEEKWSIILIISYWCFELVVVVWFPSVERSNGSPLSLIFFSIAFVSIFIIPTLFWLIALPFSMLIRWDNGLNCGNRSKACVLDIMKIVWTQRVIILVVTSIVLVTFIFDADVTFIIRYTMHGKPCWPVLIAPSSHSGIPYPLQHLWIKSWDKFFQGYSPGRLQNFIQTFGRGMGEVHNLLPMVIGVYMACLLMASTKHKIVRQTAFACIAGIVLGGVFSASLKIMLHRYRPNAYGNPYKWTGPGTAVVNHLAFSKLDLSFPAGHTSVTSAVATCMFRTWLLHHDGQGMLKRICVMVVLYTFPTIVLISRVGDCYHWNSDATFGMLLGFIVGLTVTEKVFRDQLKTSELP